MSKKKDSIIAKIFSANENVVHARLNWGKWIADCPVHGEGIAELVTPGQDFICSRCYPDIHAEIKVQNGRGQLRIPDFAMRATARQRAQDEGHLYKVVFPKNMEKILEVVRIRPLQNMNWIPGMTLDDLRRENKENNL